MSSSTGISVRAKRSRAKDDLLVQSRFKNLILYEKLDGQKLKDVAMLSGVSASDICGLLTLRVSPVKKRNGTFTQPAETLASYYGVPPEDLFPLSLYRLRLPRVFERTFNSFELLPLLEASSRGYTLPATQEDQINLTDLRNTIQQVLEELPPREQLILESHFGIGREPETAQAIADKFGLSRGRVQQIISNAIGRLQRPSRAGRLKPFWPGSAAGAVDEPETATNQGPAASGPVTRKETTDERVDCITEEPGTTHQSQT